jgi:hypothetical protein
MTTVRHAEKLTRLARQRNPELAWTYRYLVVQPVEHIVIGVFFYGSGRKHLYRFKWVADFLFRPFPGFYALQRDFSHFTTAMTDVDQRFAEEVENQLLPLARLVRTIDDVRRMTHEQIWSDSPLEEWLPGHVAVLAAMGDLPAARKIAERLMSEETAWGRWWTEYIAPERLLTELCPAILADDRATVARLLHEDEERVATAWRLDKVWRPSPFPLELM